LLLSTFGESRTFVEDAARIIFEGGVSSARIVSYRIVFFSVVTGRTDPALN